jgi:hypothetical protein
LNIFPVTYVQRSSNPNLLSPQLTWIFEDFPQIQDQPGEMRMGFEKCAYQMTVASADIANGADAGELIITERFEYQVGLGGGMTGHSLIKSAPITRLARAYSKPRAPNSRMKPSCLPSLMMSGRCFQIAFPAR